MAPQAGANGVLPAGVLQKNPPPAAPRGSKAPSPRLKLLLRRLPPGLTKAEFENTMGDEWKVGAGKVDLVDFRKGKVSKDLAKPSKPARVYMHVASQALVSVLNDHVRQLTFQDAAKSTQDSALVGPPTLEFAPFHKLPTGKRKHDTRQGTIDQDPEFQIFLESLTNPITKPTAAEGEDKKDEKVTTTPLIEALREKKANKEKPQSKSGKHGRGEAKEETEKKILSKSAKDSNASGEKSRRATKAEKAAAAKEAVKVLNKEAASSKDSSTDKSTPTPAPERKRGNASIAKSIIQRDLGGGAGPSRKRGTKREATPANQENSAPPADPPTGKQKGKETQASNSPAASNAASTASTKKERPSRAERRAFKASLAEKTNAKGSEQKTETQTKAAPTPTPTILKKPQAAQNSNPSKGQGASRAAPTEPAASRAVPTEPAASRATNTKTASAPRSQQTATATPASTTSSGRQAFLKHANPSQGITEPLIEEALKVFGAIEKVEIDKRKGFAYVDFVEADGLQKAISASPVKVAQGAVHVLERKEKVARAPPVGPARGGRGGFSGRGRGRGGARGGHATPAASTASTPAPAATPAT